MILAAAMMLRYSLDRPEQAARIENAVKKVLKSGLRTGDIWEPGCERVGTRAMGGCRTEGAVIVGEPIIANRPDASVTRCR